MARQSDGSIVIGGVFNQFDGQLRRSLARLNPNGLLDPGFVANVTGSGARVRTLVIDPAGRILVGGDFSKINDAPCTSLARLLPDGTVDTSFRPVLSSPPTVHAIHVQNDGRVVVGGKFETVNGTALRHLVRLLTNGVIDPTFEIASGPDGEVKAIVPASGNRLIVGGAFTNFGGSRHTGLVRLFQNGMIDSFIDLNLGGGFPGYPQIVAAVAVGSDGSVLVGGTFWSLRSEVPANLVLFRADGRPSSRPDGGAGRPVLALAAQSSGGFIVAGDIVAMDGAFRSGVARLHADGAGDPTFTPGKGFDAAVLSMVVEPAGTLVVGGSFQSYGRQVRHGLARLKSDGTLDESFTNALPFALVSKLLRRADGSFVAAGVTSKSNIGAFARMVGLLPNGSIDTRFVIPPFGFVGLADLALAGNSDVVAAGFFELSGPRQYSAVRFGPNGELRATLPYNPQFEPLHVAIEANDDILVCGRLQRDDDHYEPRLYRLHSDGTLDPNFNPRFGSSPHLQLYQFCRQSDGRFLIGGFRPDEYQGGASYQVRRFLRTGEMDPSFTLPDPPYGSFFLSRGEQLLIASLEVKRFDPFGVMDPMFQTGQADIQIQSVVEDAAGRLLVGGYFRNFAGSQRGHIARLHGGELPPGKPIHRFGPETQYVPWGQPIMLNAVFVSPPATQYRWYKNGNLHAVTETARLNLGPATSAEVGDYFVTASNAFGIASSPLAYITVDPRPKIILEPTTWKQTEGSSVTFDALIFGRPPIDLRWFHEMEPIPGATSASLTLSNLTPAAAGNYFLVASNSAATAGGRITLTILPPLRITDPRAESPYSLSFTAAGPPSGQFRLQRSLDLQQWMTIGFDQLPAAGSMRLTTPIFGYTNEVFRLKLGW
jgi:uncharacterized delta-60 repeat protein